jgi:hypothetical protein
VEEVCCQQRPKGAVWWASRTADLVVHFVDALVEVAPVQQPVRVVEEAAMTNARHTHNTPNSTGVSVLARRVVKYRLSY